MKARTVIVGSSARLSSARTGVSHGTAGCGPACPVVWEEGSREACPIPICSEPRHPGGTVHPRFYRFSALKLVR